MADKGEDGILSIIDPLAPEGWRRRVAAAMLQIGLGSRRAAEAYGAGREALDTIEGRSIVNKALAEAVAKQAINDPEQIERAKARYLGKVLTEQDNVESVLGGAERILLSSPPPSKSTPHGSPDAETIELDADWVAAFTRQAEIASTPELRDRLSRILAGQVRTPGSFSRAVFRTIIELEQRDVAALRAIELCRWDNVAYLDFLPEGDRGPVREALSAAGLLDHGLLAGRGLSLMPTKNGLHHSLNRRGAIGLLLQSTESVISLSNNIVLNQTGMAAASLVSEGETDLRDMALKLEKPNRRIFLVDVEEGEGGSLILKGKDLIYDGLPGRPLEL